MPRLTAEVKVIEAVLLSELHRVEGVISVIEAVLPDVERLWMLLQLLQLLDDRRPHRLRDNGVHHIDDLAQLDLQLEDVGAPLTPVEDGLQFLGESQAGLHTDHHPAAVGHVVHVAMVS